MRKIKLEDKTILPFKRGDKEYETFLIALKEIEVGKSFFFRKLTSQHRLVLSACKILLNKEFITRKEKDGARVYRHR